MAGQTSLTLGEGMTGMMENVFIDVKNRSLTITADLQVPAADARGVVIAQGGRFGDWGLYLKDGKPAHNHNYLGLERYTVASSETLPAGRSTLVFDFAYDGGGAGKGGMGILSVNGREVAEGRIGRIHSPAFTADETADVGIDEAAPVVDGIGKGADKRFNGTINTVEVEIR